MGKQVGVSEMIAQHVRTFIVSNFLSGEPEDELGDDDLLLEGGVIDSGSVLMLVAYLEDRFDIQISDEDLFAEKLGTIERITAFVASRYRG
jgi:acyl carrier protein